VGVVALPFSLASLVAGTPRVAGQAALPITLAIEAAGESQIILRVLEAEGVGIRPSLEAAGSLYGTPVRLVTALDGVIVLQPNE
jgi:hypothetical protein